MPSDARADLDGVGFEAVKRSRDGFPTTVEAVLSDLLGRVLNGVDFDLFWGTRVLDDVEPEVLGRVGGRN